MPGIETSPKQRASGEYQNMHKLTIINIAIGPDYFSENKIIHVKNYHKQF